MKKKGFTLAEILIALSVIGILASMTIPALIQNVNSADLKIKWRKVYDDFVKAGISLSLDHDGNFAGAFSNENAFRNAFMDKMLSIKICTQASTDGCWHTANNWKNFHGTLQGSRDSNTGIILNDGTIVIFEQLTSTCTSTLSVNNDACGEITVDINGFKSPNTVGKDIFKMYLIANGDIYPTGTHEDGWDYDSSGVNHDCDSTGSGWNCSADYLYD